ncbi:L-gulonolactone oxidase 3 [Phalaenopsis equestris]|uniref:L-gulonolactone oxidase 3 n=1 Tax=Phalaenopsis equestris TaxID=78828 RepID=UPI0009E1F2E3|nr:L-gulonolactone oxidase 3 [Phalaenopsis equestris]
MPTRLPLLPFLLFHLISPSFTLPPAPPIHCNSTAGRCTISNAFGPWNDRHPCLVPSVVYPSTEEELLATVASARRLNLKVKVVSGFSHTIPKLVCPPPTGSLLISTARYNSGVAIDPARRTVTVDAGTGLRDIVDAVEEAGFSLLAAPYWEGVSIAGLISTGSHGSSWWGKGGAVHEHVVAMRLVVPAEADEGFAKVVEIDGSTPELLNAARVSIGLLGVISKVTLSLEPKFKRSITYDYLTDEKLLDEFEEMTKQHEFFDIDWYPSQGLAVYRLDDRAPWNSSGDGVNDFIGFQANPSLTSMAVRATEKALEESKSVKGKCAMAATVLAAKKLAAIGLKNNNFIFTGYPVIGSQSKMQTSGSCLHSSSSNPLAMCSWDPRIKGLFFYETTAIFPASNFRNFVLDVKKLRDLNPQNFCGVDIYNGFLIRFIKASSAYLGQAEDSVVVDFNYYRADEALTPRLNQDVWEEVEQMAFFKHGARPHWGKNRKVAFFGVQEKYPDQMRKFNAVKQMLDPTGMFSSEWSDEVLLGMRAGKTDGCALEGLCICSKDMHCSPSNGYFCKSGLVYGEAKVCRFLNSSMP